MTNSSLPPEECRKTLQPVACVTVNKAKKNSFMNPKNRWFAAEPPPAKPKLVGVLIHE
jgi:hypothetical protein